MSLRSTSIGIAARSDLGFVQRILNRSARAPDPAVVAHAGCAAECEELCALFAADGAVLWRVTDGREMLRIAVVGTGVDCTAERIRASADDPWRGDTRSAGVSSSTLADLYARRAGFVRRFGMLVETTIRRRGQRVAVLWLLWNGRHRPCRTTMQRLESRAQELATKLPQEPNGLGLAATSHGTAAARRIAGAAVRSNGIEDVLAVVVEVVEALLAPAACLVVAVADGSRTTVQRGHHPSGALDCGPVPVTAGAVLESLTGEVEARLRSVGAGQCHVVPLQADGAVCGALGVAFDADRRLDASGHGQLEAIAMQAGIALDGALLFASYRERTLAMRSLAQATMRNDERQRHGLARTLQDEVVQRLGGLVRGLRGVQGAERTSEELSRIAEELERVTERVRATADRLRPATLQTGGLMRALQELARAFEAAMEVPVEIRGEILGRLPHDVELCVYRIAQEGLTNALKHAAPQRVVLTLGHDDRGVSLCIRDDGSGFDTGARRTCGTGLLAMQERTAEFGGSVRIRSKPGRGTTIEALVALSNGRTTED